MKRAYWIIVGLVLLLAFGLLVSACGESQETTTTAAAVTTAPPTTQPPTSETTAPPSSETTVANTTPIKVGIAISLTGDSAAPCEQIKLGFETEAKYMNANGGINGRQIELIFTDDQSKMDTAMAVIQSLIDQKVDVVIGPFPQWTQPPARELTEAAGVFHIAFGPPSLENVLEDQTKYTYSFAPATGCDGAADAYLREMVADGRKVVLGIGDQIPMSGETLKVLSKTLPAVGVQFTLMSDTWSLGEADVTPIANKIAAKAKEVKPDALILCSNPVHVNQMIKILRSLGVTVPVYNQGSASHPLVMFAAAGNDPANVAGNYCIGPAIANPAGIPDEIPNKAELIAFVDRFMADNPKQPFASLFLGFAYDTLHLAAAAMTSATTQDAAGYAAALEKVDWWGAEGHYKFSETDHIGGHGGFMQWQYTNGQGFKFVRDLNALSDPELLPETVAGLQSLK